MLKLRENGLNIDYMYETNSVLRKTAETEISDLTFWLRFGSVRVFINRNRTEIRFPHIPTGKVTVGLASQWPCVTDSSCITTYRLMALVREMSTPPTL